MFDTTSASNGVKFALLEGQLLAREIDRATFVTRVADLGLPAAAVDGLMVRRRRAFTLAQAAALIVAARSRPALVYAISRSPRASRCRSPSSC